MTYILGEDEAARTGGCIFCVDDNKAKPDKARLILYVGRLSMIMMNKFPYNNGHLLVAPRRHVPEMSDLFDEELLDLTQKVRDAMGIMRQDSSPDGFNVGLNVGRVAGAGVEEHMHFHIVPRWNGDTNFMTVFDDVRVVPEHLEAAWDRLAPLFARLEGQG